MILFFLIFTKIFYFSYYYEFTFSVLVIIYFLMKYFSKVFFVVLLFLIWWLIWIIWSDHNILSEKFFFWSYHKKESSPDLSLLLRSRSLSYQDKVSVVKNPKVDTTPPSWLLSTGTVDPYFRTQKVLPYTGERNYNQYIVIPQIWVVVPLVSLDPTSSTYRQVMAWNELHWKYFSSWAIIYPGTPWIGQTGNSLIGAHSNYYYSDPSYYRTIFTTLPELIQNDVILWLSKSSSWRIVYKYRVMDSYQTAWLPDKVIAQPLYKKRITLYTCVPIGTSKERRIVQAELFDTLFVPFKK